MSRIAKKNIIIPKNVEIKISESFIFIQGPVGSFTYKVHNLIKVLKKENKISISVKIDSKKSWSQAGTARSIIYNQLLGVQRKFEKKLLIIGVGYRAKLENNILYLMLGFSHSIKYAVHEMIDIKIINQTEIIIQSSDKRLLGQTAAEIRSYKPPEPYKGKGIRYENEYIFRKSSKKK